MPATLWWCMDGPGDMAYRAATLKHEQLGHAICCAIRNGGSNLLWDPTGSTIWWRQYRLVARPQQHRQAARQLQTQKSGGN